MMNTFLQATAMPFGERAAYAGKMLLIGMMAVFGSLAILWLALALFRRLVTRGGRAEKPPTPPSVQGAAPVAAPTAPKQDDAAIVAAITAAVAATLAAENGGVAPAFRVVSFRRVGKQ